VILGVPCRSEKNCPRICAVIHNTDSTLFLIIAFCALHTSLMPCVIIPHHHHHHQSRAESHSDPFNGPGARMAPYMRRRSQVYIRTDKLPSINHLLISLGAEKMHIRHISGSFFRIAMTSYRGLLTVRILLSKQVYQTGQPCYLPRLSYPS
jgi:hypothetical protein